MPAIANVLLTHTFDQWRLITNQMLMVVNEVDANGNLIRFSSGTGMLVSPSNTGRGGIITISANLTSDVSETSNLKIATANLTNVLHDFTRTSFNQANSAYGEANLRATTANLAIVYTSSNSAMTQASAAYGEANLRATTANLDISFSQANAAYSIGNTGYIQANAAYIQANAAYVQANTARDSSNNTIKNNSTTLITVGYKVQSYNIGRPMTSFTIDPTLGHYQYGNNNAAITITAPTDDCAVDILITNDSAAGAITLSGFTAPSGGGGDTYVTTSTYKFLLMVRRINTISTYSFKGLQ